MEIQKVNDKTAVVTGMQVPVSSFAELVEKAGIKTVKSTSVKNAIIADIQLNGGFMPNDASNEAIALLGNVMANSRALETAKSKIALAFAIVDETQEYTHMHDMNGKVFKSTKELFKAVFPSIGDSTARNYLACGKQVYLPALKGTLDKGLQKLAETEPGMLQFALSSMKKDDEKEALVKELAKVKPNSKGKYSAADIKNCVSKAKEAVKNKDLVGAVDENGKPALDKDGNLPRENGTAGTDKKDEKAKKEVDKAALKTAMIQVLAPEHSNGEIHFTVGEDRVARFRNTLKEAAKSPNTAKLLIEVLIEITDK